MLKCPRCGSIVEEGDKYCSQCGIQLEVYRYRLEKVREFKEESTKRRMYLLIVIIFAIVILATIVGYGIVAYKPQTSIGIVAYPDIQAADVNAKSYIAGLDVRAKVTAVLYNYGSANGYAVVKLYTKWDTTRDESIQSVFVSVGQHITVQADLDVPAFSTWLMELR